MAAVFDQDKYKNGEWQIAATSASSHYEKLGFESGATLSDKQIEEAFYSRYDWWQLKDKQYRSGQELPILKEIGPSIQDAINNLREAKSVLLDPIKKAQYDKKLKDEIVRKAEEKFIEYIYFCLPLGISLEEKRNLLNQADNLKIDSNRAEEILLDEMNKAGAKFTPGDKTTGSTDTSIDPRLTLESDFENATKRDKKFYPSIANFIYEKGRDLGLDDKTVTTCIDEWIIKYNVAEYKDKEKELDKLIGKTYYEILGVPEDADYAQIKEAYEKEYQKYNTSRDKAKASARFFVVSEAWDCLKDTVKRRIYDDDKQPPIGSPDPVLVVERKNDADYTFKDIRKGTILTEKIVIKNTEGGQLQGTIKSDVPWIELSRNNLLKKNEQPLYITVLTSKIPSKTYITDGKIIIDTNAGIHIIPFKVVLENYEAELKRFRTTYVPLSAAFFGLISSFIAWLPFLVFGSLMAFLIAVGFIIFLIAEKAITNIGDRIKVVIGGIVIGWITSAVVAAMSSQLPHLAGFIIGVYMFGGPLYLLSRFVLEFCLNKGIDTAKFHPAALQISAAGIVILTIISHSIISYSVGNSDIKQASSTPAPPAPIVTRAPEPAPKPTTVKSQVVINRSGVAEDINDSNVPIGVNTVFHGNAKYDKDRRVYIAYFAEFNGAIPERTLFEVRFFFNSEHRFGTNCQPQSNSDIQPNGRLGEAVAKKRNGIFSCRTHGYYLNTGNWEVRLLADGTEINRTQFEIVPGQNREADNGSSDIAQEAKEMFEIAKPYHEIINSDTAIDRKAIAEVYLTRPYEYECHMPTVNGQVSNFNGFARQYPNSIYVPEALLNVAKLEIYSLQCPITPTEKLMRIDMLKKCYLRIFTEYKKYEWSTHAKEIHDFLLSNEKQLAQNTINDHAYKEIEKKTAELFEKIPLCTKPLSTDVATQNRKADNELPITVHSPAPTPAAAVPAPAPVEPPTPAQAPEKRTNDINIRSQHRLTVDIDKRRSGSDKFQPSNQPNTNLNSSQGTGLDNDPPGKRSFAPPSGSLRND